MAAACGIIDRFRIFATKRMKKTFASLPPVALWVFAGLLAVSGAMDAAVGLQRGRPIDLFFAVGPLAMAAFLAWCALQRRAGRDALLASPRVTLAGYVCFGIFVGGFLVKLVTRGATLAA